MFFNLPNAEKGSLKLIMVRLGLLAALFSAVLGATEETIASETRSSKSKEQQRGGSKSNQHIPDSDPGKPPVRKPRPKPKPRPRPKPKPAKVFRLDEWNTQLNKEPDAKKNWIEEIIKTRKQFRCNQWCCTMNKENTIAFGQMLGFKECCAEDFYANHATVLEPDWEAPYADSQWTNLQLEIFQWIGVSLAMRHALKLTGPKGLNIPKPCKACARKLLDEVSAKLDGTTKITFCPLPLLVDEFRKIRESIKPRKIKYGDLCIPAEKGERYDLRYHFPPRFFRKIRKAMESQHVVKYKIGTIKCAVHPGDPGFHQRAKEITPAHRVELFKQFLKPMKISIKEVANSDLYEESPNASAKLRKMLKVAAVFDDDADFVMVSKLKVPWETLSRGYTSLLQKRFCLLYQQSIKDGRLEVPKEQRDQFLKWLDETIHQSETVLTELSSLSDS